MRNMACNQGLRMQRDRFRSPPRVRQSLVHPGARAWNSRRRHSVVRYAYPSVFLESTVTTPPQGKGPTFGVPFSSSNSSIRDRIWKPQESLGEWAAASSTFVLYFVDRELRSGSGKSPDQDKRYCI